MSKADKKLTDTKKNGIKFSGEKKGNIFRRIFNYFKELKIELKKVVWPNKKSVFSNTAVVAIMVVIVTLFVFLADFLFTTLLKLLVSAQ